MNKSLRNLLRNLVGEQPKKWGFVISQAEFAYNSSVNCSTRKPPFEVIYGRNLNHVLDLFPLSNQARVSMKAEEFATHINAVHEQVQEQLKQSSQAASPRLIHKEEVWSSKKVIWLWLICKKNDFQRVLITSSSKWRLFHAEYWRSLDKMHIA